LGEDRALALRDSVYISGVGIMGTRGTFIDAGETFEETEEGVGDWLPLEEVGLLYAMVVVG
jgi:hypothetical protein